MGDSIVIKSRIKDFAKVEGKDLNVTGDFADALSKKVITLIQEACQRARANARNTVMVKDL